MYTPKTKILKLQNVIITYLKHELEVGNSELVRLVVDYFPVLDPHPHQSRTSHVRPSETQVNP